MRTVAVAAVGLDAGAVELPLDRRRAGRRQRRRDVGGRRRQHRLHRPAGHHPDRGQRVDAPGHRRPRDDGPAALCTGCERRRRTDHGGVTNVVPDTKSGTPGADAVKVKGTITWVGVHEALAAEMRLYERLFTEPQPDAGGRDFLTALNPHSKRVVTGYVEPSLGGAEPDAKLQIEGHGYFVADRRDHTSAQPVFNRVAGLKDSWGK